MRLWLKFSCAKSSLVVAISTVHGISLYTFYNHFQQQVAPLAASLQLICTPSLAPLGSGWVGAVQSPPRNKIATIKIELWLLWKLFHFKSEDWFGEMVLPKRGFKWFQGISSQSIPSRPEAIDFRVTAWLDNFSSVRGMYSCLWKQQQTHPEAFHILKRKNPWSTDRLKCTEPMGCLNLRLGFGGALQTTYPATQSKSNWLLWKPILGY